MAGTSRSDGERERQVRNDDAQQDAMTGAKDRRQPEAAPNDLPPLTLAIRALLALSAMGLSIGFALAVAVWRPKLEPFLLDNQISGKGRAFLLNWMLRGAGIVAGGGGAWLLWKRRDRSSARRLLEVVSRLAPVGCVGFLPLLFRWHTWRDRPLVFLVMTGAFTLAAWGTVRVAQRSPELWFESRVRSWVGTRAEAIRARWPRLFDWLPLVIVAACATAYIAHFSYYTIQYHHAVRSGFDLGIKNNIFWNTLHGAPFKASPTLGPEGLSHFGRHADLLVYVLLPVYRLWQEPETLLVLQSTFIGGAALPLYAVARRHVGQWVSALIAVAYLMHPAIHGANLFEFHFLPLGLPLLWTTWALLDRGRWKLGAVFAVLTLMTREDVALWVVILGAYHVLSGRRPRSGLVAAVAGTAYFVLVKFVIMPKFAEGESFTSIYGALIPPEDDGFAGVLKTLVGNPSFTLSKLLSEAKLIYLLQLLLPLAMLPMRRSMWVPLAVPGFLLTILPPEYRSVYDIYYQYSPHWLAFMFPATALGIEAIASATPGRQQAVRAASIALVCGTLPVSYQYGAVLQHNTARGGPGKYVFGMDAIGRARRESIVALRDALPPDAKVACSALTAPQFSSRADAYDMNQGIWDAEYFVFPTDPRELIVNEKRDISERLRNGTHGVVRYHPPFALAKRGHSTEQNALVLDRWK